MRIYGLQKLTLLDYPGQVACTVFTGGCNLRCPFCHNASLVLHPGDAGRMEEADFFRFLEKRRGMLDGVCVSGGEPMLQPDLEPFLQKIKALGYRVKLDTNGCFPERLGAILAQGLVDSVAMDIKSAPGHYAQAVGIPGFDASPVLKSIALLLGGGVGCEFRTTVVKGLHTEALLRGAAQAITGAPRYYLQKFVDSGDVIGEGFSAFSDEEMRRFLEAVSPYVKFAALRGI